MSINEGLQGKLEAGLEELGKATASRKTGFANMETMFEEAREVQVALGGMVKFFQKLKVRLEPELGEPFRDVQQRYQEAASHIIPALEGASPDNEYALNARFNVRKAATMGDDMVNNLSVLGLGQENRGSVHHAIVKLLDAAAEVQDVVRDLGTLTNDGDLMQRYQVNAQTYTELYRGEL